MPMVTTDRGLAAITNAEAGGFLVDLSNFALTEAPDVKLAVSDTKIVGEPVFAGKFQSIEVVSGSTVKLTIYIPPKKPENGTWNLTEIGLYLKSGELFAHGTFKTPREKTNEFGLKVIVFVTAARLGNVINVTLSTNASLASTANVRSLVDPQESDVNAVVIQDSSDTLENVTIPTAGSLAVRYGAGGLNWSFLGHDLAYRGKMRAVIDKSTFEMNVQKEGGFWLNHNEIVIIQIVSGAGAGESRRVKYNRNAVRFEVQELPFTDLNKDSILQVWRSTRNQLPTRNKEIDAAFVLGVGKNTWIKKEVSLADASTDLIPKRISLSPDGASASFALPGVSMVTLSDRNMVVVWLEGKILAVEEYDLSIDKGLVLYKNPPAAGAALEVVVYETVKTAGSALTFVHIEETVDGSEWAFSLPIVPRDSNYILVFLDDKLVHPSEYNYSGTSVTFTKAGPIGALKIVCCANFEELGASTAVHRVQGAITLDERGNVVPFDIPNTEFVERRNVLVFVDGKLISQDAFDIDINRVTFNQRFAYGQKVSIIAYESRLQSVVLTAVEGENTGPVWVDPAGSFVPTSRINPVRVSYMGNGQSVSYRMQSRAEVALAFIDGLLQDPRTVQINPEAGILVLPEALAPGKELDIVSFEWLPDEVGQEVNCWRQNFTTVNGLSAYVIAAPAANKTPLLSMVTMGGVYVHASQYVLTPTSIAFIGAVPANQRVEIWHFASNPSPGMSSVVTKGQFDLSNRDPNHIHAYADAVDVESTMTIGNTLLFANTVMQAGNSYVVNNESSFNFVIPSVGTAHGVKASSIVFHSGKSKTRLVKRDELLQRYMTREEIEKKLEGTGGNNLVAAGISGTELSFTHTDGSITKIPVPVPVVEGLGFTPINKAGDKGIGQLMFKSGNPLYPAIVFEADLVQDSGFYHISDGHVGVALDGSHAITFQTGGNIIAQGTVSGLSDITVKDKIQPIRDALSIIRNIKGVTYKRTDMADDAPREAGFIAQNVASYFPEVVRPNIDGKLTLQYGNMVAVAYEAVTEVDDKVVALNWDMAELKDKVASLEKLVEQLLAERKA